MTYEEFFRIATGREPYPYQIRLASMDRLPDLVDAPTGAGKTAAIVLAWLWRRSRFGPEGGEPTPRRLAYCLPMRVLVEQAAREVERWVGAFDPRDIGFGKGDVHVLMGGVEPEGWDTRPERGAILIGTQDMLLSRALNRGYGTSRFRWPMPYAWLNNDCLWVFDEVQLMGAGVATSAQLSGLRRILATSGPSRSIWMSATMEETWLSTVDHRGRLESFDLDDAELTSGEIGARMTAEKRLRRLAIDAGEKGYPKTIAGAIKAATLDGPPGSLTLVVMNTVDRARDSYEAVRKIKGPEVLLLHSRFRPPERKILLDRIGRPAPPTGRIIISTQVIEAGVDLSATTLFTELAPWSSVVQRLGRLRRHGEQARAGAAFWIDLPSDKLALPYEPSDLDFARTHLDRLEGQDVSPFALRSYQKAEGIRPGFEHRHVIRRRDVLDLFDTTPDLSGNDIDVSRYVRGDDPETDVRVFWRQFDRKIPTKDEPAPTGGELCPVPVGQARVFLGKLAERRLHAWIWDHLSDAWRAIREGEVRPGMVLLLPSAAGGYSWSQDDGSGSGWDAQSQAAVRPLPPRSGAVSEGTSSDPLSSRDGPALTIEEHTGNVREEMKAILDQLESLDPEHRDFLELAALWHDVGKSHQAFQEAVRKVNGNLLEGKLWAKSGKGGRLRYSVNDQPRPFFRHELASALAALDQGLPFAVAYLSATHHGKVRLSIRSLPGEIPPRDGGPGAPFALGVHQDDILPETRLDETTVTPPIRLDLSPMKLGDKAGWSSRSLALLKALGPFRLAYLEALLRAADMRASAKERDHE